MKSVESHCKSKEKLCREAGLVIEGQYPDITQVIIDGITVNVSPIVIREYFGTPEEKSYTILDAPRRILEELTNQPKLSRIPYPSLDPFSRKGYYHGMKVGNGRITDYLQKANT